MMKPTGQEVFFKPSDFLVSKTNLRGVITYANRAFVDLSQYSLEQLIGRPHSIIRHPDMPSCIFRLLWNTLYAGALKARSLANR